MNLVLGDCIEKMRELEDCSIDAVVTDPPYGIGFMGKVWDGKAIEAAAEEERRRKSEQLERGEMPMRLTGDPDHPETRKETARTASAFATAAGEAGSYDFSLGRYGDERDWAANGGPTGRDNRTHSKRGGAQHAGTYDLSSAGMRGFQTWTESWAKEAHRILKPGGYLLCFAATRTYHRMACGVEEAGFEIRDTIAWMFGQGFPKSLNLDGDWLGWGTALKPGFEPIVVARKPFPGTVAKNMEANRVGALNIAGCRIEGEKGDGVWGSSNEGRDADEAVRLNASPGREQFRSEATETEEGMIGRWPANVILDDEAAAALDAQTGDVKAGGNVTGNEPSTPFDLVYGEMTGRREFTGYADSGGPSRFFYCPKVSRTERSAGLDGFEAKPLNWSSGEQNPGSFQAEGTDKSARNNHPTVKPIDLMRWLIRLVTPPQGTVLDPFLGSGSTGCAAVLEDREFVGIERETDYMAIAQARIAFWKEHGEEGLRIVSEQGRSRRERQIVAEAGQLDLLEAP